MRLRRAALPLGFLVLAAAWPAPLLVIDFSWTLLATAGAFFGTVGAVGGTLAWWLVVGDAPTPRRGAVAAAVASVATAVLCVPVLSGVIRAVAWTGIVTSPSTGSNPIVGAMLVGLVALVLSPLSAALGHWVGGHPARGPAVPEMRGLDLERLRATPSTRTLAMAFALLALAVVGTAAVQSADPTTPKTGDGPAYAGPDAPAATQVEQAQARTRSVSHTVVWTVPAEREGAPPRMNDRLVLRHDMQRDVLLFTSRYAGKRQTHLVTVDGHWYWPGNDTAPPPDAELTRTGAASSPFPYFTPIALDAPAEVTNRTDGYVEITYEAAHGSWHNGGAVSNGTRTVRIDTAIGRVVSVTDCTANGTVIAKVRFEDYRSTSVDPPATPVGPVDRIVEDLFHGPLTGEGTLHD